MPDKLREVSVVVLHTNICDKMLSGYPWDKQTNTMLCAGGEDKVVQRFCAFLCFVMAKQ